MHLIPSCRLYGLLSLVCISANVTAQFQASFTAKTDLTALAYYRTTGTKTAKLPRLTSLIPSKSISVSNVAVASVSASFTQVGSRPVAKILESATGRYTTATTTAYSKIGPHSTLLVLKSARATNATLRVTWSQKTNGVVGAGGGATVDLGDNGKIDWRSATSNTQDFPVRIDSKGLSVATTTFGSATASSRYRFVSYNSQLTIEVLPPKTCLFFSHGKNCGLTMTAENEFFDGLHLSASGAKALSVGALLLGVKRTQLTLPGTSCQLNVQPAVVLPLLFDGSGRFSLQGTVPVARPFLLVAQTLAIQPSLSSSLAWTVFCP